MITSLEFKIPTMGSEWEQKMEVEYMNNVLKLWYDRKKKELEKTTTELIDKAYSENPAVKEYLELTKSIEESLNELKSKYPDEIISSGYKNVYDVEPKFELKEEIYKKYQNDFLEKEIDSLTKTCEEIDALLSISHDKDYQIDVLTRYGIIDKKGKFSE